MRKGEEDRYPPRPFAFPRAARPLLVVPRERGADGGRNAPRYGTWWSPCDEIINPDDSVLLSGAANMQTACVAHTAMTGDLAIYRSVRDFVHR